MLLMCENEVPGFYIITIFGKNCYLSVPLCLKSDDIRIMINFDAISADCFESVNINVCVCVFLEPNLPACCLVSL